MRMRRRCSAKTIALSGAKARFSSLVGEVSRGGQGIVITKNGQPVAALVSADEYDSWRETNAVRSDAGLIREIKSGLCALKAHKARRYTLDELFK